MQVDVPINYNPYVAKFIRLDNAIAEYNNSKNPINEVFSRHGFKKINSDVDILSRFDYYQQRICFPKDLPEIDRERLKLILKNINIFISKNKKYDLSYFEKKSLRLIRNQYNLLKAKEDLLAFKRKVEKVTENFETCTFDKNFDVQNLPCEQRAMPRFVISRCLDLLSEFKSRKDYETLSNQEWIAYKDACLSYIERAFQEKDKKSQKSRLLQLTKIIETVDQEIRLERIASLDMSSISKTDVHIFIKELKSLLKERHFFVSTFLSEYTEFLKDLTVVKFIGYGGFLQDYGKGTLTIDWEKTRELSEAEDMALCLQFCDAWNKSAEQCGKILQEEVSNKKTNGTRSILQILQAYSLINQFDALEHFYKSKFFNFETNRLLKCPEKVSRRYFDLFHLIFKKMSDKNYAKIPSDNFYEQVTYLKNYLKMVNEIGNEFQKNLEKNDEFYRKIYEKAKSLVPEEIILLELVHPDIFEAINFKIISSEELEEIYEKHFNEEFLDRLVLQGCTLLLDELHVIFYGYERPKVEFLQEDPGEVERTKHWNNHVVSKNPNLQKRSLRNKKKKQQARTLSARIRALSLEEIALKESIKVAKQSEKEKTDEPLSVKKKKKKKHKAYQIHPERKEDLKGNEVQALSLSFQVDLRINPRNIIEKNIFLGKRVLDWFLPEPQALKSPKYSNLPLHVQNKVRLFHKIPPFMIRYEQSFGIRSLQRLTSDSNTCSYTLVGQIEPYGENAHEMYNKEPSVFISFRGFYTCVFDGKNVFHHCFTERPYNNIMAQISQQGFIALDEDEKQLEYEEKDFIFDNAVSLNPDPKRFSIHKTAHTLCVDDTLEFVRYTVCLISLSQKLQGAV